MDIKLIIAIAGAVVAVLVYYDTRKLTKYARDTHARLHAENGSVGHLIEEYRKFKMAFESTYDMIVITDADGIVLYGNDSIKRITGYSAGEAMGEKAGRLWGKQMPTEFYEQMWKTVKLDRKPYHGRMTNIRKDGTKYAAEVTISPILDEDTKTVEYFVAVERVVGSM